MSDEKLNNSDSRGKKKEKIFGHLLNEVINPKFCIGCGACAASCPVDAIEISEFQPELVNPCRNCNFCYYECPQTGDSEKLKKLVFGESASDSSVGVYKQAFSIKTTDKEIWNRSQDGGAVTSMLIYLLDQGIVDAAVVMGSGEEPWSPEPKVVSSENEIIENAGTIYSPGPAILGLKRAVERYSKEKIAFVGTPCQVKALRRMQFGDKPAHNLTDHLELVIGLFCMEAYDFNLLKRLVEGKFGINLEDVRKFDVKGGKFIVYTDRGKEKEISVNSPDLKERTASACKVCPDFTSELSDISVGSVGSPDGYSTVIVRSETGMKFFKKFKENSKMLEISPLEEVEPGIRLVEKLSNQKRESSYKELDRLREEGEPIVPWAKETNLE